MAATPPPTTRRCTVVISTRPPVHSGNIYGDTPSSDWWSISSVTPGNKPKSLWLIVSEPTADWANWWSMKRWRLCLVNQCWSSSDCKILRWTSGSSFGASWWFVNGPCTEGPSPLSDLWSITGVTSHHQNLEFKKTFSSSAPNYHDNISV